MNHLTTENAFVGESAFHDGLLYVPKRHIYDFILDALDNMTHKTITCRTALCYISIIMPMTLLFATSELHFPMEPIISVVGGFVSI